MAGGRLADQSLVSWFDYATPFWATVALLACVCALTASQFVETLTIGAGMLAVVMGTIVIPNSEGPLWVTLGATALVLAVCLPAAAAIVSERAEPEEQGRALGSNQSLQVGAEAASGLGGGLLAAIADVLPLTAIAALAAVACLCYRRVPTVP